MYGNLRSKLDLQEENFPFSLTLKESSLTMRSFLCRSFGLQLCFWTEDLHFTLETICELKFCSRFSKQLREQVCLLVN